MKTSELTGAALDWAVAKCQGSGAALVNTHSRGKVLLLGDSIADCDAGERYNPSINWAQGGPIIERERIQISPGLPHDEHKWSALKYDYIFDDGLECFQGGDTPLIAALRCYVASRLGDEVEIPEELK